ncbi:hypothetical protein SS50377_20666 [Spironucleus salmonicida]|uniref:Uncharacterized protein n=1 Tax=Spironucleus salmonicida TaxID=348837 RepID=V6LY62_9EUKA|nr:hypothetical protein SS50377_28739 [Spironucleus salmonicida]KAH0577315.1 hypothetical protein SS50377_20666 [Spironucleus salmonicida]|eukprot:EST49515.1 Hypothetical protein SS50377_10118 [Spironucleus salmonicida]
MKKNIESFSLGKKRLRNSQSLNSLSIDNKFSIISDYKNQHCDKETVKKLSMQEQETIRDMLSRIRLIQDNKRKRRHEHVE